MARPPKKGLDYFPLDRDFYHDRKIRRVLKACGPASGTVLTCLLGNIYYEDGYYIRWDEDLPFDIADLLGMSEGQVQEIINVSLKAKFFDEGKFKRYGILTSVGIQRRYINILSDLRRSKTHINWDYWLLGKDVDNSNTPEPPKEPDPPPCPVSDAITGINAEETNVSPEETPEKGVDNPQTKRKETKRNEIKQTDTDTDNLDQVIMKFISGFKNRFSVSFSPDDISALRNSVLKNLKQIQIDYYSTEIFFRTVLRRMEDINTTDHIKKPIPFLFSGAFGKNRYLWELTKKEEDAGSGYHKPLIRAAEKGTSPIAGLKAMA
jgi:hypothetical protein